MYLEIDILFPREQQKKLGALQAELEKAKQEGFVSNHLSESSGTHGKKKLLAVIGIVTRFGRKNNRDAIRKAWMPSGTKLLPLFDLFKFILTYYIILLESLVLSENIIVALLSVRNCNKNSRLSVFF